LKYSYYWLIQNERGANYGVAYAEREVSKYSLNAVTLQLVSRGRRSGIDTLE